MIICLFKLTIKVLVQNAKQWKQILSWCLYDRPSSEQASKLHCLKLLAPSLGRLTKHFTQIAKSSLLYNPISIPHSLNILAFHSFAFFFFFFNSIISLCTVAFIYTRTFWGHWYVPSYDTCRLLN